MKYGKNEYCFGNNYAEIMTNELLGTLDADTFDELIESYITQSESDMMSFEAFKQGAQRLAQQAITETIEVTGVVKDNKIVFESSEPTLVTVHDNELWIGGLRLVIKLRQPDT